jgi:hypothetical protein
MKVVFIGLVPGSRLSVRNCLSTAYLETTGNGAVQIAADDQRPLGKHPKHYTSPPRDRARQVKQQDSSQLLVQLPNNDRGSTLLSPSLSVFRGGGSGGGRRRRSACDPRKMQTLGESGSVFAGVGDEDTRRFRRWHGVTGHYRSRSWRRQQTCLWCRHHDRHVIRPKSAHVS